MEVKVLQCPQTLKDVEKKERHLHVVSGNTYEISKSGIPLFAKEFLSEDAKIQQEHYDKVAAAYLENVSYPHTQEYMDYLDRVFLAQVDRSSLGEVAEICCGGGEALGILAREIGKGVGVDISISMLEAARKKLPQDKFTFVQGDATMLPLKDAQFTSVFMLGGIHHVNNREKLFQEVFRVLKPGGRFYFREPVSDFFLWHWIRLVIYRLSPALDADTERPLMYRETEPPLKHAGFELQTWKTYGFLGFCFFMNSDILIFNRLFRFLPGIRALTRFATWLDDITLKIPGFSRYGLQVVGVAKKPGGFS